jgi:hypothetical protein
VIAGAAIAALVSVAFSSTALAQTQKYVAKARR